MGIFSRNKKEKDRLFLVFDIGSSSVGGALFGARGSGIPKIIFSTREPIILQKSLDIDQFLSSTVKSLEIVVGKIYKAGMEKPEEIFCVLSSPWYVSQTRVIKFEKNTPFIFTSKLALGLIQKEITLFEEEYLAKYSDIKSPVRSIEFKNIKTMLNGYETSNPLNQKTSELEMAVFISISGEQILKRIEETIRGHFHFEKIRFSSFAMASFAVVRDIFAESENFLLIDVGGEVTDISMVKKNTLRESVSFPLGCNFIIREVASALHLSFGETRSILSLFRDGHATDSMVKKIDLVMNELRTQWLKKFQESLVNLSNDISIPSTVYLAVDKGMASFFSDTIKNEQFNQYTLTESKFKIIFLGAEVFNGLIQFKENLARDTFLSIDSIYINRFLINQTSSDMENGLEKI
ncbi:MAG: hypothetical protein WC735_00460 [Candidatus Paceibacterota bacterium]|jgi:hypothetical protein